jgi:YaiO family outer membrane protein
MFSALLLMSMLAAPQASAPPAQAPTHAAGEALASAGQLAEALETFRRLAAANPRDHQARLWIARLHGSMGHPDQAEPVYRSVLLEDPASLDAMFGLGMTLVALGDIEEGIEMLERAERAQPQDPEVLNGLSQAHAIAGNGTRAVLYAERALSLSPSQGHRMTLEQARVLQGHRVEIATFGESFDSATRDTGSIDLRGNFRVRESLRVVARGQHQRKFGFSEQRGGGGVEWRWTPRTSLFGHVLVGGPDNVVLPRADVAGELTHASGDAAWAAGYRYFNFPSAHVSVLSPGVTWWARPRVSLAARYYLSLTEFAAADGVQEGHSIAFRLSYGATPRVWVNGGYTRGTDNFETLSPDRLGDYRADTVSGGVRVDLPSLTSLLGLYEHSWRPDSIRMHRLSVSLVQRF